ncbi:hypothetical protein AVEN_164764-1 [Araneus ventricosus]|uniref:Uncharacterized protein n=1 Tax=Araneus ventricosus TaxID=182803 RepID=A0A4Y2DP75_ARAVE|nr:hypothetical protein AVEN_164764-1 [Araneus ventricosus]
MPKRDGPYLILTQKSPASYVIASLEKPTEPIATYHTSALSPFKDMDTSPVSLLRNRGRPPKITVPTRATNQEIAFTFSVTYYIYKPYLTFRNKRNSILNIITQLRSVTFPMLAALSKGKREDEQKIDFKILLFTLQRSIKICWLIEKCEVLPLSYSNKI